MNKFVIQKVIRTHQVRGSERLCTWRTISELMAEKEAITKLHKLPWTRRFRALNSPSNEEMWLGGEVTEWTN